MENWVKFRIMGCPIKMKSGVTPHIFQCQSDRRRTMIHSPRPAAAKRLRAEVIEEALRPKETQELPLSQKVAMQSDFEGVQVDTRSTLSSQDHERSTPNTSTGSSDVGIQVVPHFRSKAIQTKFPVTSTASSPIKFKYPIPPPIETDTLRQSCSSDCESSDSDFKVTDGDNDEELDEELSREITLLNQKEVVNGRLELIIKRNTKLYLGLPQQSLYVLDLLVKQTNLEMNHILLTLKKIRLAEPFSILADDFGISASCASRIFCKTVPLLALCLKELIFWPERKKIVKLLPMPFRARYSNVQSIIDCLEIEIEKPSNSMHQALTWSEYKHCNTIKYLISSTPDGFINFISEGYSGRISDSLLFERCDFLKELPSDCAVMADRGFKHVEQFLIQKRCTLIRPPSVGSGAKISKEDVMQTKRIASLRIHIERLIRRLREFNMLKPHACVDHNLIAVIDEVIVIASALINLQAPLVRY